MTLSREDTYSSKDSKSMEDVLVCMISDPLVVLSRTTLNNSGESFSSLKKTCSKSTALASPHRSFSNTQAMLQSSPMSSSRILRQDKATEPTRLLSKSLKISLKKENLTKKKNTKSRKRSLTSTHTPKNNSTKSSRSIKSKLQIQEMSFQSHFHLT